VFEGFCRGCNCFILATTLDNSISSLCGGFYSNVDNRVCHYLQLCILELVSLARHVALKLGYWLRSCTGLYYGNIAVLDSLFRKES